MSDRDDILKDAEFWSVLEFGLSGWFRTCGDRALGGFWCDGFTPESSRNTKEGIEVTGIAWIVDGKKSQHKCTFTASIPQRMLSRRRSGAAIRDLVLDLDHQQLAFSVAPVAQLTTTESQK